MKIMINIPDKPQSEITGLAIRHGFMRENPRKAWTGKEVKEAARFAAEKLIENALSQCSGSV